MYKDIQPRLAEIGRRLKYVCVSCQYVCAFWTIFDTARHQSGNPPSIYKIKSENANDFWQQPKCVNSSAAAAAHKTIVYKVRQRVCMYCYVILSCQKTIPIHKRAWHVEEKKGNGCCGIILNGIGQKQRPTSQQQHPRDRKRCELIDPL